MKLIQWSITDAGGREDLSLTREKLDKHSLKRFYKNFQIETKDYKTHNREKLMAFQKFFMEKIRLEKRKIYVIGNKAV